MRNEDIRELFENILSLLMMWKYIVLRFIGRLARQKYNALSYQILWLYIDGLRLRGHIFHINKDTIVESL